LSDKQSLSHPLQAFVEGQNAEGRTICLSLQLYHLSFIIYHLARLWRAQAFEDVFLVFLLNGLG
jgi:hypothetical protein